jgi:hypothetical protein
MKHSSHHRRRAEFFQHSDLTMQRRARDPGRTREVDARQIHSDASPTQGDDWTCRLRGPASSSAEHWKDVLRLRCVPLRCGEWRGLLFSAGCMREWCEDKEGWFCLVGLSGAMAERLAESEECVPLLLMSVRTMGEQSIVKRRSATCNGSIPSFFAHAGRVRTHAGSHELQGHRDCSSRCREEGVGLASLFEMVGNGSFAFGEAVFTLWFADDERTMHLQVGWRERDGVKGTGCGSAVRTTTVGS